MTSIVPSLASIGQQPFLVQLTFGFHFNMPVAGVGWPASLARPAFGYGFVQSISGVDWPLALVQLIFVAEFNQPLEGAVLPAALRKLDVGLSAFNQWILGAVGACNVLSLRGWSFNPSMLSVVWPASLVDLTLGGSFSPPTSGVAWPKSVSRDVLRLAIFTASSYRLGLP